MKITHICQVNSGGAFQVAQRLNNIQNSQGHQSSLTVLNNQNSFSVRILYKALAKLDFELGKMSNSPLTISVFKGFATSLAVRKSVKNLQKGSIVHLHWLPGLNIFYPTRILKNYRVIWTIHDTEPITGICHNNFGCKSYLRNCSGCFQIKKQVNCLARISLMLKKRGLGDSANLIAVLPSHWLHEIAKEGKVFANVRMQVIPNPIPMEYSRKHDLKLGMGRYKNGRFPRVGILGSNYDSSKGAREAFEIVNSFGRQIEILTLGLPHSGQSFKHLAVSPNSETNQVMIALESCDVFLYMSAAESFGNVVAEAQSLGVPVISKRTGGIPEIIIDEKTGNLISTKQEAKQKLLELIEDDSKRMSFSRDAQTFASEKFDPERISQIYLKVYEEAKLGFIETAVE